MKKARYFDNIYNEDLTKHEYAIRFGNAYFGFVCNKELLKKTWGECIRKSKNVHPGDVSLFYKGEIIRMMNNGENKILDKEIRFPYMVRKW